MSLNTLRTAFRNLAVNRISTVAIRYYLTQQSKSYVNVVSQICNNRSIPHKTNFAYSVKFIPGTLNIDFGILSNGGLIKSITDIPFAKIPSLQEPERRSPIQYDFPVSHMPIDLPTNGKIFEKQAVRLIVIRRKKMKKHKRKKLRKKMQFVWEKIRIKRNQTREKLFQAELISKIKEAQAFDAKEYVKQRLNILNKERIPRTYRGEILPTEMIKQFRAEKEAIKAAKRNKPRLTL